MYDPCNAFLIHVAILEQYGMISARISAQTANDVNGIMLFHYYTPNGTDQK